MMARDLADAMPHLWHISVDSLVKIDFFAKYVVFVVNLVLSFERSLTFSQKTIILGVIIVLFCLSLRPLRTYKYF